MNESKDVIRVAFCYHFFPHYRRGFFSKLVSSEKIRPVFWASPKGLNGIKVMDSSELPGFAPLKMYRVGGFLFQPGLVFRCIFSKQDCFVFLADPNHITTWIAALICRLRGLRVIFWGHGFSTDKRSLKNGLRKVFFGIAHAFYAYGWRAKENARRLGCNPSAIHVGFNSLDYDRQLLMRKELESESKVIVAGADMLKIICVSRLTVACRYDLLLEAMAIAKAKFALSSKVQFVGGGAELESLRSLSVSLGIDADFLGPIYDEMELSRLIFYSDVTIMPGKIGLTAMHSLMYGTPVISHSDFSRQMPEVESIVPGYTGDFFRIGDADSLADSLVKFRENSVGRDVVRRNCYAMIDSIYNPARQVQVMLRAISGEAASEGDEAFQIFPGVEDVAS